MWNENQFNKKDIKDGVYVQEMFEIKVHRDSLCL